MAETDQDDKTEAPSQKRLDDAKAKGDVPRSVEVNSWFILAGLAAIVSVYGSSMNRVSGLSTYFLQAARFSSTQADLNHLGREVFQTLADYLFIPFAIAMTAAMLGPIL